MEEDIGLNWSIHWQVWKSRVRIFRNSIGEGRGVRRSVSKGLMISKGDSSPFCRGHLRQQGHLQPPHCQCMVWSKIHHHFSSINNFGISQTFPRKNLTAEAPYLGPVITTLVARLLFPLSTKIHFLKIWKPWTWNCQSCVVLLLPLLILDSLCAEFEISCIMINSRKWA